MNPHQLRRLFPHASKSVLDANSGDFGNGLPEAGSNLDSKLDSGQSQRGPAQALALAGATQEALGQRITVRITVHKCGILQDPDNIFVKAVVDQLRYCGLISDDNSGIIKLEVEQVRVKTKAEQGTEIEVIFP